MTLILKLDLDVVKIYLHTKHEVSMSSGSKVIAWTDKHRQTHTQTDTQTDTHTDRQTDMTENITYPHTRVVINIERLTMQSLQEHTILSGSSGIIFLLAVSKAQTCRFLCCKNMIPMYNTTAYLQCGRRTRVRTPNRIPVQGEGIQVRVYAMWNVLHSTM